MRFFQKMETVFEKKDKEAWKWAAEALKKEGISFRKGSFEEEPPVCGCGAKLDPRNFGAKGAIDRSTYVIRVPETDAGRAREVLYGIDKKV